MRFEPTHVTDNIRRTREESAAHPGRLSAGQRQRVAIARAMIVEPSVLLLDEPFAHLDKNLRLGTAEFIRTTQKNFGVTTVSVTHDLEEAFAMSDRIGIMLDRHNTCALAKLRMKPVYPCTISASGIPMRPNTRVSRALPRNMKYP